MLRLPGLYRSVLNSALLDQADWRGLCTFQEIPECGKRESPSQRDMAILRQSSSGFRELLVVRDCEHFRVQAINPAFCTVAAGKLGEHLQATANPRILRIEIRVSRHANERRLRFVRRADAPISFFVDVEPDKTFDERETGAEGRNDFIDPLAF
jgi:hypothetical protein